jgi:AraC-like DNA-binding protein
MAGASFDDRRVTAAFAPQVVGCTYDGMLLVRLTSDHGMVRIPANVDSLAWPFMAIYALSSAQLRHQAKTSTVVLRAGECYFIRNRVTDAVSLIGSADLLIIQMPAEAVSLYQWTLDRADGCLCSAENGTTQLVGKLLEGLAARVETYEPANPARFAHNVLGLLTLMLADSVSADPAWSKGKLLERSKDFIERHLADADLTPACIAAVEHMSSRNLYRIFESEGLTVGRWIRRRRLEHCRLDLGDSALDGLPVSRIAARWGLWEAAHFSRLFKAAYGVSPRAYRVEHASRNGLSGPPSRTRRCS